MSTSSKSLQRLVIAETKLSDIKLSLVESVLPFCITIRYFTVNKLTVILGDVGFVGSNVVLLGVDVEKGRLGLWDTGTTEVGCAVVGIVVVGTFVGSSETSCVVVGLWVDGLFVGLSVIGCAVIGLWVVDVVVGVPDSACTMVGF